MKYIYLIPVLSLSVFACERQEAPPKDNTEINVRDREKKAITPFDQSEKEADREITQKIRQAIMADGSLSMNAKNIKIITIEGVVTLRGPVADSKEKDVISRKVKDIKGINKVDNQLEITKSNK